MISCNMSSTWCQTTRDHNWVKDSLFSSSLWNRGRLSLKSKRMWRRSHHQRRWKKMLRNPSLKMILARYVKCREVAKFGRKAPPDKAAAVWAMNLFDNNVMLHFPKIFKRRQEQVSLDRFLTKVVWKFHWASKEQWFC